MNEQNNRSLYENIRYLFFSIYPNIETVKGDSLDITFEIVEDEIATIRRGSFTGNTKTHDDVVRRTLRNVPGETYRRSNIVRSIRELGRFSIFSAESF